MASGVLLYVLLLAATTTSAETPIKWTHLYVQWGQHGLRSLLPYSKMPLTTKEANEDNWVQVESTLFTTLLCLPMDPRVCMLYDLQGTVAGMQISVFASAGKGMYLRSEFKDLSSRNNDVIVILLFAVADFDFPGNDSVDNHPQFFKNNMYDRDLYSTRYYLVDQATLAAGGRPPSEEVGTGLWLQSGPDLVEVPRDGDQLVAQSWTGQNCVQGMGRHFFYNMSKEMPCEDLLPYYLLLDTRYNSLHGVGLQMFRTASVEIGREGLDSEAAIDSTIPDAPACLKELAVQYSIIFIHIYFVACPSTISC